MPAAIIEFFHAVLMVLWVGTLPLLFWHRWPKLSLTTAIYTVTFALVNRVSHLFLGECVLTRLARMAGGAQDDEWFTVKFARFVCGFIPTNHQVAVVEQVLIVIAAIGAFWVLWWKRR